MENKETFGKDFFKSHQLNQETGKMELMKAKYYKKVGTGKNARYFYTKEQWMDHIKEIGSKSRVPAEKKKKEKYIGAQEKKDSTLAQLREKNKDIQKKDNKKGKESIDDIYDRLNKKQEEIASQKYLRGSSDNKKN